jgi:hypothetical protein
MIETITPAVCGSRRRHMLAFGLFTLGAVLSAAALGAALGLVGLALGSTWAVAAAAALAGLAALRELGLVPFPLPQARRQVPERWHAELPLPVWASGYGAGLGLGVFTFQPVATFWVACAAAIALGRPLVGAACFALYGAGRALMVVLPRRGASEPGAAAERLARRRPVLVKANAGALAACAVILALATPAAAAPLALGLGSQFDPSVSSGVMAFTQRDDSGLTVIVRATGGQESVFPGRSPSLDEKRLAFADDTGVRVVRWRDRAEIAHIPAASRPALDWPWLAYRHDRLDGGKELWLRNLETGATRVVVRTGAAVDVGRPSLAAGRLAWHVASARGSSIGLLEVESGRRSLVVTSKIGLHAYPALTNSRIVWVEQRQGRTFLRLRRFGSRDAVTLGRTSRRSEVFWTTAMAGRNAYVTRWFVGLGLAQLERIRF